MAISPRRGLMELKGRTFGSLFVMQKVRTAEGKKQNWRCRCVCGKEITVRHDYLLHTNSPKTHCGCLNKGPATLYHDEYHIWNAMLQRCYSVNHVSYKDYGGRGITVCQSWRDSFLNFLKDMGRRPSKAHSIDRIDPNGNYELYKVSGERQVQWATDKHQARNKRQSLFLKHPSTGLYVPAAEVAELLGVSYQVMRYRYMRDGLWNPLKSSQLPPKQTT